MSAVLTQYGVQADSQAEVMNKLVQKFRDIYGQGIELTPNTPDGQVIGIFSQAITDISELIKNLFASLFPSTAEGVFLDYNLDLIGLIRNAGLPAMANIEIDYAETLSIPANAFAIQIQGVNFTNDNAITAAGIYSFTSSETGFMQFADDEQVNVITAVLGLTAAFNSTKSNGRDYETDFDFKKRWSDLVNTRDNSATYMESRIRQILGVTDCNVYGVENAPFDTLPMNCIFVVLKPGNFDNIDVLDLIYALKPAGIQSYFENTEASQQGTYGRGDIVVGFDLAQFVTIENYVFNFYSKSTNNPIDSDDVLSVLKSMKFRINETVFVSSVNSYVMSQMTEWYADINNNIGGEALLAGQIREIYEF